MTDMNNKQPLLPCPFCNSDKIGIRYEGQPARFYALHCDDCGGTTGSVHVTGSASGLNMTFTNPTAIKLWQTRNGVAPVEPTPTPLSQSAMMITDIQNLRHMLGAEFDVYPRKRWGFRNYYFGNKCDEASLERLATAGFAYRGKPYCDTFSYHATTEGMRFVGVSNRMINLYAKGLK